MGALPESKVTAFIERLAGPAAGSGSAELMEEASARAEAGDAAGAAELYGALLAEEPDNVVAIAALAKLYLDLGDLDGARRVLEMAPAAKAQDPAISGVRAAIELAEQAASLGDLGDLERKVAADPDDHQARFDLALGLNSRGKREEAAEHLLAIVRRDRTWQEDGARKQLVQLFEAWGPTDPATVAGRKRLSSILFS